MFRKPLRLWDVCADDFLGAAQGGRQARQRAEQALPHSPDKVLPPLTTLTTKSQPRSRSC